MHLAAAKALQPRNRMVEAARLLPPVSALRSASLGTLGQKIFEKEFTLATLQWTTAGEARYFAICRRAGWGFNPNDLVRCPAIRTMKQRHVAVRHATDDCCLRGQREGSDERIRPDLIAFVSSI